MCHQDFQALGLAPAKPQQDRAALLGLTLQVFLPSLTESRFQSDPKQSLGARVTLADSLLVGAIGSHRKTFGDLRGLNVLRDTLLGRDVDPATSPHLLWRVVCAPAVVWPRWNAELRELQ